MSKEILNIGAAKFTFTPAGEGATPIEMNRTFKENDTKLTITTETKGVQFDQETGEKEKKVISQEVLIETSTPIDYTKLAGLTNEWKAGTAGAALSDAMGMAVVVGTLDVLPKGSTTGDEEELKFTNVEVKVDIDAAFKVEGLAAAKVSYTATADSNGVVMQTGNYVAAV